MANIYKKVLVKPSQEYDELTENVAKAFLQLNSVKDLQNDVADLQISKVREIGKVFVISIPYRQKEKYQRICQRLREELRKKLSSIGNCPIVFIPERVILPKSHARKKGNQQRPRSRTLTSVHNAILEDIVYPGKIVGKRTRYKKDGTRRLIVEVDQAKEMEQHFDGYAEVYKTLTKKEISFKTA